jgi:predicted GNAT superfamily acetyltransferase
MHTPRPLELKDLGWVHALNQAHMTELSDLTVSALQSLIDHACYAQVIDEQAAFLIALDQNANYDGINFQWFKQRYHNFVYIERVAVSGHQRGMGLAKALYRHLFEVQSPNQEIFVCEVNEDPPNPASKTFHTRLGFKPVGSAKLEGRGKSVCYYENRHIR